MIEIYERRARQMRSRVAVRAWKYRQRAHSSGIWFRLRRVLADASDAFVIPEAAALELLAEGQAAEAVGNELEPPKVILFVSADRLARVEGARQIGPNLDAELLAARHLALVRFGDARSSTGGPRGWANDGSGTVDSGSR